MYLHAAGGKSVVHVSQQGGMVTRWDHDGVPVFYPQRGFVRDELLKLRGGLFEAVPNFGSPRGPFQALPQHGLLRHMCGVSGFGGIRKAGTRNLTVDYSYPGDLSFYPWPFEVSVATLVHPNGFQRRVMLGSRGRSGPPEGMPFEIGFRPYLNTPLGAATVILGDSEIAIEAGELAGLDDPIKLSRSLDTVEVVLPGLVPDKATTVEMAVHHTCPADACWFVYLWREGDAPYLCVELVLRSESGDPLSSLGVKTSATVHFNVSM